MPAATREGARGGDFAVLLGGLLHTIRGWFFILSLASLAGTTTSTATSISWINTSGGNWNVAANWSPSQVPGSSDTVWITNNGTYTVTVSDNETAGTISLGGTSGTQTLNLSGGNFTLSGSCVGNALSTFTITGGTLTGAGTATLYGAFRWTVGSIQAPIQFANGTIGTGGNKFLYTSLINNGTMAWNDTINSQSAATVISNAVGATITLGSGVGTANTGGVVANSGAFTMTGPGASTISQVFNNAGTVNVSGTLSLTGSGTETGGFSIPSGSTLSLNNGTWGFQTGSSISNSGTVNLSSGTINFTSAS
ncbi:MAG TPA: hypothetical protein VH280_00985, partial [Verrucomicrobiae bacterium]|nr:hypothetical protein [Verrucomicrobiae bacterium]